MLIFLSSRTKCEGIKSPFQISCCTPNIRSSSMQRSIGSYVIFWMLIKNRKSYTVHVPVLKNVCSFHPSHMLAPFAVRAGRTRCSLRARTFAISTLHSKMQNPGRFHIVYTRQEKEKYGWLFVSAALLMFSLTCYVSCCCQLHHQFVQCEPISCMQDDFVLYGAAYQDILQILICRMRYGGFSFSFCFFCVSFFLFGWFVGGVWFFLNLLSENYLTNYRKDPRGTF